MIKNNEQYRYLVVGVTGMFFNLVSFVKAARNDYRSTFSFSSGLA
ncbi:hypothetical protein [Bartonella phoceensis]|nr:hypothetical protein [Bartonella phoceensis]